MDRDEVADRLAPRQLVAVVLERPDEDHRPLVGRDVPAQVVAIVEVGRQAQVEDVDEAVDRARRARAAEDHRVLGPAADGLADDLARLLAEARRLEARPGRLRVRVRVQRQDRVADEVLDEREAAAGRRVVGIGHAAQAEGRRDEVVAADDRGADRLDQALALRRFARIGRGQDGTVTGGIVRPAARSVGNAGPYWGNDDVNEWIDDVSVRRLRCRAAGAAPRPDRGPRGRLDASVAGDRGATHDPHRPHWPRSRTSIARADLGAALADALPPFDLAYGPARTFPNSSVIYVAVEPAEPVLRLRAIAHATGLFRTDLPFADAFVPHITVREWPGDRAAGKDVRLEEIDAVVGRGQFVCSALELWRPDKRGRFGAVEAVALVGA